MLPSRPTKTLDPESEAKNTLVFLSEYDNNYCEWDYEAGPTTCKRKYRLLDPIKNVKLSRDKNRNTNTQSFFRGRTALVTCKVSLENQQPKSKKKLKSANQQKNPYQSMAKENYRPHKMIRNNYSLTKQADEKEEEQGFDFMQFWIRHRFEDGAITSLVERLKEKNTTILRL